MLFNERSKAYITFAGLDVSKVFFETDDAGYSIYEVYKRAAAIKKMATGDLARIISSNFAQCFNL
jgi:Tat protein secretion system quality control protein TatD with DNase activity